VGRKILIIDDEAPIREMIGFVLSSAGYDYTEADNADRAEDILLREQPDLILMDWMMPGRSGIDFARQLRRDQSTRAIPIIMLTARGEEDDKVRGLNTGADDYVTKPFAANELVARIEAVLRRTRPDASEEPLRVGALVLDPVSHRVFANEQALDLGPTEFRLLQVFLSRPDRAYTRAQLLDLVWGYNLHVGERTVDMHVSNLRKALDAHGLGHMVQTVRGVGYRLFGGTPSC
jgi:two-component system phosphate regulon response regulator PhoB